MTRTVVGAVDDMIFASKIRAAAEHLGIDIRFARNRETVLTVARETSADLIVVDLQAQKIDAVALARELKADEDLRNVPIIGFFSHVMAELQREAKAAGIDSVVPRSVFSRDLARILTGDSNR